MAVPLDLTKRDPQTDACAASALRGTGPWPRRWVWAGVGLGLLAGIGYQWARAHPNWVERSYSEALFPRLRGVLGGLSRLLPVSLAEVLIGCLLLLGLGALVRAARQLRRGTRTFAGLLRSSCFGLLGLSGYAYASFLLCWGLNHARQPYGTLARLPVLEASPTANELGELLASLVAQCNRLRPRFDSSALQLQGAPGQADPRLLRGFGILAERVEALAGLDPVFRKPWSSPLLSRLGILGIYSPFTAEAHLNTQVPLWAQPFSACHEVAHAAGFAREDEANFIAWQVCRASGDEAFAYSASYVALSHVSRALKRLDALRAASILTALEPFVLQDQLASYEFWRSKHSVVTEVSQSTNDAYLKAQGQSHGSLSYGRMVELMIAERRQASAQPATPGALQPPGGVR